MAKGKLSPLAKTFASLLGTQAAGRAIRFLYTIALARVLSTEEVGLYLFGIAFYLSVSVFAGFGQGPFLSTRLKGRRANASHLVSHSLLLSLTGFVLATGAGLAFVWSYETRPAAVAVTSVLLLSLIPRGLVGWVRDCAVALEEAAWIPRYETAFRSAEALIGMTLLLAGGGLLAICYLHVLGWILEGLVSFRCRFTKMGFRIKLRMRWPMLRRIVRISIPLAFTTGLIYLFTQVGLVTLKFLQPDASVLGYFGIAMQFMTTLAVFPLVFGMALLPALSRLQHQGRDSDIAALATVVKAALLTGGIVAILADAYSNTLFTSLLGERYAPAATAFAILSWALGPYAVAVIVGQALNALEGRAQAAIMAAVMIVAQIAGMAALIGFGGLQGVAAAFLIASVIGCVLGLAFLRSRIDVAGSGWWTRPLLLLCGAGILMAFEPVSKVWLAPLLVALVILMAWRLNILSRDEMRFVLVRFTGGKPPGSISTR